MDRNEIVISRAPGQSPNASNLPTDTEISDIMQETTFAPFATRLEGEPFGAHDQVHVWVGGTMSRVPTAPADPIFWLHHAEVDRLWDEWQKAHSGQTPNLRGTDAVLDPWPEKADEVLTTRSLGYIYG